VRIVGQGFVARNLAEAFGDRYPRVTALAAGISSSAVTAAAELDREAELVYQTLAACREQHATLLFFSTASFAMYGSTTDPATEDGPLCPPSVYGRHKLALESCVQSSTVDHLILRLSHLVGPYQRPHQFMPALVGQIRQGTVTVHRGAFRDLLEVRDLVAAVDGLLAAEVRGQVVNVVSGVPQPVDRIVDGIEIRLGTRAERVYVPSPVTRTWVSTRRLVELAPRLDWDRFGPGYLDDLLDRHLPPDETVRAA
jgi:nucleoside-diphosphate-sugar epimerase